MWAREMGCVQSGLQKHGTSRSWFLRNRARKWLPSARRQEVADIWQVSAEQLSQKSGKFDVILCLWNVLGHLPDREARILALKNMANLLSRDGTLFIDVNNRYNANSYGCIHTFARMFYDFLHPSDTNGDVTFSWQIDGKQIPAMGHFFTPREMKEIIHASGFCINHRYVVNYRNGNLQHFIFQGQLVYQLKIRGCP